LSLVDADSGPNTRIQVQAKNIDVNGFDLVFSTWFESKNFNSRAIWFASGDC